MSDNAGDNEIASASSGDSGRASEEGLTLNNTTKSWTLILPDADVEDEVLFDETIQHQQMSFGLKLSYTQEFDCDEDDNDDDDDNNDEDDADDHDNNDNNDDDKDSNDNDDNDEEDDDDNDEEDDADGDDDDDKNDDDDNGNDENDNNDEEDSADSDDVEEDGADGDDDDDRYDNFRSACLNGDYCLNDMGCEIPTDWNEDDEDEDVDYEEEEDEGADHEVEEEEHEVGVAYVREEEEEKVEKDYGGERSVLTASMTVSGESRGDVAVTLRLVNVDTGEELAKQVFTFTAGRFISMSVKLHEGSAEDLIGQNVKLVCDIRDRQQEKVPPVPSSSIEKTTPIAFLDNLALISGGALDPFGPEETLSVALNRMLLFDPSTCDTWLVFGDQRVACHSLVLRARSPVFASMFKANFPFFRNDIVLDDRMATKEVVHAFLRFLYTDTLDPELSADALMGVVAMAAQYAVAPLKRASERALLAVIEVDNAAGMLVGATNLDLEDMRKTVMGFVVENTLAVMDTAGFKEMSKERPELLCDILHEKASNCAKDHLPAGRNL